LCSPCRASVKGELVWSQFRMPLKCRQERFIRELTHDHEC
jgi:hypothetical protein